MVVFGYMLLYTYCDAWPVTPGDYIFRNKESVRFLLFSSFCFFYLYWEALSLVWVFCDGICARIRNMSMPVSRVDISRQPQSCAERYSTVGVDPLACVSVWKWHHFVSSVHESGIASPVNSMNYVWQEKVKATFCIICRPFSKLTFGQPFAGFRRVSGLI